MNNTDNNFFNNKILLIDKPPKITSATVLNKVKRALNLKKIGHSGTLDKEATGLLVLCTGQMTKLTQYFLAEDKKYYTEIALGISTDTDDMTGEILKEEDPGNLLINDINEAVVSFRGKQKQRPPQFSALKINGKRASDRVRNGEEVELKERDIEFFSIDIDSISEDKRILKLYIHCSKGTYIRSLARDIGEKLGVGASMHYLRRLSSGQFSIDNASEIDDLEKSKAFVVNPVDVLHDYSKIMVSSEAKGKIFNGAWFSKDYVLKIEEKEKKTYIIVDDKKNLIAIADIDIDKWLIKYYNVFNNM